MGADAGRPNGRRPEMYVNSRRMRAARTCPHRCGAVLQFGTAAKMQSEFNFADEAAVRRRLPLIETCYLTKSAFAARRAGPANPFTGPASPARPPGELHYLFGAACLAAPD